MNEEITITIKMKNGTVYEKKKIPYASFGQNDRVVFWIGKGIMKMVPLADVKECIMYNVPE